ncbi:MAG: hypothetical protein M3253_07550 [Chloroflexota bacterium]|nr:hypothetical protein [Chloroflexota bacterium]
MSRRGPRFTLLGVGAAASPRYPPAGLLIEHGGRRVAIDGGPGAEPEGRLDAWLVTDERAELMPAIRRAARARGLEPRVATFEAGALVIEPRAVVHTSHPAFGYIVRASGGTVVWAPEFWRFPEWAAGPALMFADAAGWSRPIRFARGVGGHAAAIDVAAEARARGVRRLILAHLGRPTLRALDAGERPVFGEIGEVGRTYRP